LYVELINPFHFSPFFHSPLFMVISIGLKILNSFLHIKYITSIHLPYFLFYSPHPLDTFP
jgi:hypothetical protein